MQSKYLSIIVPVFNAEATFEKCLHAISNIKGFSEECELIVADDDSTDSSLDIARKYTDKIVCSPENKGAAFTRNLGARSAQGEFLLFVDSDVMLLSSDILSYLKEDFARNDICGITGVYGEETIFINFFSAYKHLDMCFHEKTYPQFPSGVPSAILVISRNTFLESGGFNENFCGTMAEDIEFSIRLSIRTGKPWMKDERIKGAHFKKYAFLSLLRIDYLRVKGLARIIQRKDYKDSYFKSCPSSAFYPLMSALLTGVLFFSSIFYFNFLWFALASLLLFFLIKLKFFRYLKAQKGFFFALLAVFFSFFEMIFAGITAFYWRIICSIYKFKI